MKFIVIRDCGHEENVYSEKVAHELIDYLEKQKQYICQKCYAEKQQTAEEMKKKIVLTLGSEKQKKFAYDILAMHYDVFEELFKGKEFETHASFYIDYYFSSIKKTTH